jgi:tight adherence protein B
MDALLIPILAAAAAGSFVLGVARVAAAASRGDRRKLAQRLSTENRRPDAAPAGGRAVTVQLQASGLPAVLARARSLQAMHRALVRAYPNVSPAKFLAIAAAAGVTFGALMFALTGSPVAGAVAVAFAAGVPAFAVAHKGAKRQRALCGQLPEALDFLARILQAGHSLSTGLQMMAEELPKPLSAEFRQCYDQHSLGQPLEDALKDTAARVGSTDFAFFVTAVLIQRQTGGDLSEVLRNISGMIRARIRLLQQVKAKTAEGRFTGYVMVAFPVVMFFIASSLNPEYSQVLLHTTAGLKLLALAGGLQVTGLFAIRKITTVKV